MKRLLSVIVICVSFAVTASAQTKALQTAKISTPSVQCELCKIRIESVLKRYDGITYVNVNYKKKETVVKYLTDRCNEEIIKTAIANAGYDANDIAANPEVYKTLPKTCKKPEDGGLKSKQ